MTIAFWCVFIAAILPYVPFGMVKGLDPRSPRVGARDLTGRAARAYGAHLNAFEAFPAFAAAVIISHLSLGASAVTNVLALLFLIARGAHIYFYLADRPPQRSASFFAGALIIVALFLHAAWG